MLKTLDQEIPGSNPAGGGIQLMTVRRFIAESFIISRLSSRYDINVERNIKHQAIIICFLGKKNKKNISNCHPLKYYPGPSCSKLTMSLLISLRFVKTYIE